MNKKRFINKISLDRSTTPITRIETKIQLKEAQEEYNNLLIESLKDQYDSDVDDDTCSECGHTNKLVYDKVPYPTSLIGRIYFYPFLNYNVYDIYIKLHLIYFNKKVKGVCLEYDYFPTYNYPNVQREDEIYYSETEEDIEMRFGDSIVLPDHYHVGNFYYKKGNVIKRLTISVDYHMGYNIWGGYIYTRNENNTYTQTAEWKHYDTWFT